MNLSPQLFDIIPKAGLVLIAGGIRQGKTALAYGLVDDLHAETPERQVYAYNFPSEKAHLLPEFVTPLYDFDFPENAIVIVDEAYLGGFSSKDQNSEANRHLDTLGGLAGQKDLLVLYLTQTTRKLSLASVSSVQVFMTKCPDIMMVKLDRTELRKMLNDALTEFRQLDTERRKRSVYVWSIDFEGLIVDSNTPPPFYSDELSRAWQGVSVTTSTYVPDSESQMDEVYRSIHRAALEVADEFPDLFDQLMQLGKNLKPYIDGDESVDIARGRLSELLSLETVLRRTGSPEARRLLDAVSMLTAT